MKRLPYLILAGLVLGADLFSKSWVSTWLDSRGYAPGQIHWISGQWFGVTRVMNPGVTGGMGAGIPPIVLTTVTGVAIVGIGLMLFLPRRQSRFTAFGLGLILGGAMGNLSDRIVWGAVRDFIDVWPRISWPSWLFHWPTFNGADSAIVTGVCLLLIHSLFLAESEKKAVSEAAV